MLLPGPKRTLIFRAARVALALTLLGGVLATIVPLAAVSAGSMCALACCAGRAPHADGSCMEGSCHAAALRHHRKRRKRSARRQTEKLCDLAAKSQQAVLRETLPPQTKSRRDGTGVSGAAVKQPCATECGSCVTTFSNSKQGKRSAAVSHHRGASPKDPVSLFHKDSVCVQTREAYASLFAPRGPPLLFS